MKACIAFAMFDVSSAGQVQGGNCVLTEATNEQCSYSIPNTPHGQSVTVINQTPGYAGKFEGTCLNTNWSAVSMRCRIIPVAPRAPAQCKAGLIFTWGGDVARQTTLTRVGPKPYEDLAAEALRQGLERSSHGLCYGVTAAAMTDQTMKVVHQDAPTTGQMDLTCNAQGLWMPLIPIKPGYTLMTTVTGGIGGASLESPVKIPAYMGDATCDLYARSMEPAPSEIISPEQDEIDAPQ